MDLRAWGMGTFAEDSWQVTSTTTVNIGLRYEYTSPLYDKDNTNTNLIFNKGVPSVFIGGELGYPRGVLYAHKHNFSPRLGIAQKLPGVGLGIFSALRILFDPIEWLTG